VPEELKMAILQKDEERLMTGEELARRPDLHCELVNGRLVPMPMTGHVHGRIEARLVARLVAYADESRRGIVLGGEVGIYIRQDPDTVRGADLAYISHERYARRGPLVFLDVVPELVVEIRSSEDRPGEAAKKIREYLSIGVDRVWYVDPRRRQVRVYRSPEQVETLGIGDVLRDEEILPGFSLPLSELFQD
jgi:Uma2 family endonuclease